MGSVQRSFKRNYNKHGGKGCVRCGNMLIDHECAICGWMKKSITREQRDTKAKLKQND